MLLPASLFHSRSCQLLIRIALAAPFAFSGLSKLTDWPGTIREFMTLGIPEPTITAPIVIAWQFIGSALFIASRYLVVGAALLATFTAVATVLVHTFWDAPAPAQVHQATVFFEHVALIAGLTAAAILGRSAAPHAASAGEMV